jgi:FkbM family methyltransferase
VRFFDYYFESANPFTVTKKGSKKRVVDFSTPRFQEITGFPDFPVMCPSMTEPYATAQQYVDFADLQEGDTVFDLGGYSGLTSIAFSKRVGPTGRVIVLEPDPTNFNAAQTNFQYHSRINGLNNIVLLPVAISGRRGHLDFSAEGSMGSADASIIGNFRGAVLRVEAVTLQDLVDRYDLESVSFIKMDIEGAEESVLAGSKDFFLKYAPKIIIEPHMVDGTISENALKRMLTDFGYQCDSIEQTGLTLPLVTGRPAHLLPG